jgi:cytochrome c-type biogenesis protein CcmH
VSGPRRPSKLWSWIGALVVASAALLYGAVDEGTPRTNADRAYSLAQDFACPVCQGQSVAESDVPVARNIRREIRVWVDEGRDDGFIRDELVSVFGEDIDYNPPASGISALVWILPVVAVTGGIAGLIVVFRRWRHASIALVSDDDVALVAAARDDPGS